MTPPSAHNQGSSSLMPFYPPSMHFQTPQTTVHHPYFPQTQQGEDDDEPHEQQPPRRSPRLRRRPPCDTGGHRWIYSNIVFQLWDYKLFILLIFTYFICCFIFLMNVPTFFVKIKLKK